MKTGLVDAGGGMRGVFSSGIYDGLFDNGFMADYCLGVSAGAANLITYMAGQRGRTLDFYKTYPQRKEYMSLDNFIKTGSFIGLDYIYSTLSNQDGESPLDFSAVMNSPSEFFATTTRACDGKGIFFSKNDMLQDKYDVLKASCCLPGVCAPVSLEGELYFDGGIAEPMPYEKAFCDGCDKVALILTKPRQEYCEPLFATKVLSMRVRKFPYVYDLMKTLHIRCSNLIKKAEEYEKEGKLIIIDPEDCFGMSTLTTDPEPMEKLYNLGYKSAEKILDFMK